MNNKKYNRISKFSEDTIMKPNNNNIDKNR